MQSWGLRFTWFDCKSELSVSIRMFIIPVKISNLALWLVKWALTFHLRFIYQIDICIVAMDVNTMSSGRIKGKILTPKYLHQPMQKLCRTLAGFASTIYTIRFHSHLHLSFQIRKQHVLLLVALWKPGHSGSCWRARWSVVLKATATPKLQLWHKLQSLCLHQRVIQNTQTFVINKTIRTKII